MFFKYILEQGGDILWGREKKVGSMFLLIAITVINTDIDLWIKTEDLYRIFIWRMYRLKKMNA